MDVKPMCPYCGEPMRFDGDSVHAWLKCDNCLSSSPKIYRPDWNNSEFPFASWDEFWIECRKQAEAAALRRPLQKPLTRAELEALIAAGEDVAVYCEAKSDDHAYATIFFDGKNIDRDADTLDNDDLTWFRYGISWRAWAQRPTDEERAAAPWEEDAYADL